MSPLASAKSYSSTLAGITEFGQKADIDECPSYAGTVDKVVDGGERVYRLYVEPLPAKLQAW
jgi:hypothetical protein